MTTLVGELRINATASRPAPLVLRYGLSAFGPIAVSGAHFVASLIFLHIFGPADFGLFSFLLVVVPFFLSLSGSLLGVSITSLAARDGRASENEIATHLKASLVFALVAAASITGLLAAVHASPALAAALGAYGGVMTLRWFARCYAYAMRAPIRAAASDVVYSMLVVATLGTLLAADQLTVARAAFALLGAAALSLAAFGAPYLARQFRPRGSLAAYAHIWRETTRWSLAGVVLTEMTANAHAYLVTLIAGPGAFALLAIGSLLMRPVSLVYAALPDLERPAMARAIAAGDARGAFGIVRRFRAAVFAVWCVTVAAAVALLIWLPRVVLKKGYSLEQAWVVLAIFAVIMAVRALRTPESVFLQAARAFKPLARASLWSSLVSLPATLVLLLAAGPIVSLGGILAGEIVMTANILFLSRQWRRTHG